MCDISDSGALLATESLARVGSILRIEILGLDDHAIAQGTARVVWVDPTRGIGIEFLNLRVAAEAVATSQPPPRVGPPPLRRSAGDHRDGAPWEDTDSSPVVEPLDLSSVRGIVIGIDLGTTNTCASYVRDGRAWIIPGRTGTTTIPTMVNFDRDGIVHVGQRAADRQILYPTRTVYGSKRLLGRTYQEEQAREIQGLFAYPLAEAAHQRYGVHIDGRVVSMDEITARILEEVKRTAEDHLDATVEAAIITTPAYFSEPQREAVRRAAAAADLTVLRIVNEPTAAAVAYGHMRQETACVAVYDFGGGTFDFSIVRIAHERFEVMATGGDNFVGGSDFDDLVASHLYETWARAHLVEDQEPTAQQIARLREAAELAKRALSIETEYDVRLLDFSREPRRDLSVTITRDQFDALTRVLVERSMNVVRGVMLDAGLAPDEIDDVVLVGGSSRIPSVQRAVEAFFGRRASRRINPDEAVALGAALLADEMRSPGGSVLLDVLPMTVGRAAQGRRFEALVPRGARLPATSLTSASATSSGSVVIPLFQGEVPDVSLNEYIGSVIIEDQGLRGAGRVDLRLSFDEHCVMAVEARDARSGKPLDVTLDRTRPVEDILGALGPFEGGPQDDRWKLPQSKVSRFFGKLFGAFRR